jgi:hypothetical protein
VSEELQDLEGYLSLRKTLRRHSHMLQSSDAFGNKRLFLDTENIVSRGKLIGDDSCLKSRFQDFLGRRVTFGLGMIEKHHGTAKCILK